MDPSKNSLASPKAVYIEGPRGGLFPVEAGEAGRREKPGEAVQTLSQQECIVFFVWERIGSLLQPSADLCPHCRRNLVEVKKLLADIMEGKAADHVLDELVLRGESWKSESHCRPLQEAVNPILTSLPLWPRVPHAHGQ